jgi:drug/metabolite transporter (DMT)-like permease
LNGERMAGAIIWGLAAALSWGTGDLFGRQASRTEGSLRTLFYLQLVGSPVAASFLLLDGGIYWSQVFSWAGLAGILVGLEIAAGTLLLLRALAEGPLLIVSPVASSFGAVTLVLALLSGERLASLQVVGLVLTAVGVMLAAAATGYSTQQAGGRPFRHLYFRPSSGPLYATGAALLHGIGFWLLRFVTPVLGDGTTVLVMRLAALLLVWLVFILRRLPWRLQFRDSVRWLLPLGILDTAANWFYVLGITSGLTSVVAVLASLYSVVTVILGYAIFRERITGIQKLGILTAFVGIALVSS